MSTKLDVKTGNSLWAFLLRLDSDSINDILTFPNKDALSEAQISNYSDTIMKLKARRVSLLDDLSCDALRALLSRVGADAIETVLGREWAGIKLSDRQIEEFRFDIFRFYTMFLYVPFQKAKKSP